MILGITAIVLGIAFKNQNIAFMVGLAFAIAASTNFPALLMSIVWKRFTTAGAVASMATGLFLSVVLIILSKTIWVDILGNPEPVFPYKNPAIISMTLAFVVGIIVSLMTKEPEAEEKFEEMKVRKYLGIGAE
ncbi:MAG: hypothetical protein Q9M89_04375 [Persephonella sp.]|nr:hypothetical protein [Persephonella sp.]